MRALTGAAEILAAAGHSPYVRFALAMQPDPAEFAADGAVIWFGDAPLGRLGHGVGDRGALDGLFGYATAAGLTRAASWVNLPRRPATEVPAGFAVREDWDFRWSTAPPPVVPGESAVGPVTDDEALARLLAVAAPTGELRPGHRLVRSWWGVWDGPVLVACAADRSSASVGVIGGVATHPAYRRRGLGAAVCTALTRRLREVYEVVALGVVADNHAAARIYERMGYTGVVRLTSVSSR